MRDPYAPIPTSPRWWTRAPARPPALPGRARIDAAPRDTQTDTYDPVRLLEPSADRLGIDRRRRVRGAPIAAPPDAGDLELLDVVSTAHVRVRRVLGLVAGRTAPSLVQVVSWCPHGVLARAIDPTDKHASTRGRAATHRAFRALVPELSRGAPSPLFAASLAVLSSRVVRDLAEAAPRRLAVELVLPRAEPAGRAALRIRGELAPLTDPQPDLLAIALDPADAQTLRRLWALA